MPDTKPKQAAPLNEEEVSSLRNLFGRFLESLGRGAARVDEAIGLPKEAKEFVESRAPLMPDTKLQKPDAKGAARSDAKPSEVREQPTDQQRVQAHIDHITARAQNAADLLKAGKPLRGTGYETAKEDFDRWFGKDAFEDFILQPEKQVVPKERK